MMRHSSSTACLCFALAAVLLSVDSPARADAGGPLSFLSGRRIQRGFLIETTLEYPEYAIYVCTHKQMQRIEPKPGAPAVVPESYLFTRSFEARLVAVPREIPAADEGKEWKSEDLLEGKVPGSLRSAPLATSDVYAGDFDRRTAHQDRYRIERISAEEGIVLAFLGDNEPFYSSFNPCCVGVLLTLAAVLGGLWLRRRSKNAK